MLSLVLRAGLNGGMPAGSICSLSSEGITSHLFSFHLDHSTLHNKPIVLVDSCWEDTFSMVIQEEELQKFLYGVGKSSGKGPTAASLATREKRSQMKRAQEYKANFQQGNFMFCENDDEVFIPSKKANTQSSNTIQQF